MFDFEDKTPHWINRLSFLIRAEVQRRFRAAGYRLTAEEWAMLMLLWGREPQTMSALADQSVRDRTTLTRLIDKMVEKHLLVRTEDPADRRRVLVQLTPKSRNLEQPLTQIVQTLIQQALRDIPPEDIARTNQVLQRMASNLTSDQNPRN